MMRTQKGMSLIGFILILVVAGLMAYFVMRVAPMYLDFNTMSKAVDQIAQDAKTTNITELRNQIKRRLSADYAYGYKPEFVTVQNVPGGRVLRLKYQDSRPLAYNLSLVGDFEHSAPLPANVN